MTTIELMEDGDILIKIPMSLRTFSGRKRIITLENKEAKDEVHNKAVLNALARANRWQEMIDSGLCASPSEISKKLKINQSYVMRILRLNQLSPKIVRLFLEDKAPDGLSLSKLIQTLPVIWEEQEKILLA